jgi:hypothetical protein
MTRSTLHHLANKVHVAARPREKKDRKGIVSRLLLLMFTDAFFFSQPPFPSDSRTLSPASLFNMDLSILTRNCLLLLAWTLWTRRFPMLVLWTVAASWYTAVIRIRAVTFVHAIDMLL